jgi:hypothetical protein
MSMAIRNAVKNDELLNSNMKNGALVIVGQNHAPGIKSLLKSQEGHKLKIKDWIKFEDTGVSPVHRKR